MPLPTVRCFKNKGRKQQQKLHNLQLLPCVTLKYILILNGL